MQLPGSDRDVRVSKQRLPRLNLLDSERGCIFGGVFLEAVLARRATHLFELYHAGSSRVTGAKGGTVCSTWNSKGYFRQHCATKDATSPIVPCRCLVPQRVQLEICGQP